MRTLTHTDSVQKIPASLLFVSTLNARKTESESGIDELAASILADGVIQNLVVVPQSKPKAKDAGKYGVIAGGRRCRALHLLMQNKQIPADYPVNCLVTSEDRAVQISLAENAIREDMHPADEFEAFRTLIDLGRSIEDVAASFGISPNVVQRRLKLANVNPEFIQLYRQEEVTLEQLMALAAVDDHARQKEVWDSLAEYQRHPNTLRRCLTEGEIAVDDRLVKFVGLTAYTKAGGAVRTDMFAEEDEGFILDAQLLERLVKAKLDKQAEKIKKQGFAWVEVIPNFTYEDKAGYGRVRDREREPTAEQQAELNALGTKLQEAESQLDTAQDDEELYDEVNETIDSLNEQLEAIRQTLREPDPAQLVLAGAVISIGQDGKLAVEENLLKPEDAKQFAAADRDEASKAKPRSARIHSATLMRKLTANRTIALRTELTTQPTIALAALTHAMALQVFFPFDRAEHTALELRLTESHLGSHDAELEASEAHRQLESRRELLRGRLPAEPSQLLTWLLAQPQAQVLELLAFCVALSVNGLQSEDDPHALDGVAAAAALDMRRWWKPTANSYLGSVSRARILEISREFIAPQDLEKMTKLKKGELTQAVEVQLANSGWLPERLRLSAAQG